MFAQVDAIVLILAVFAQFAFATTCSRNYKIVEGDSCIRISQQHNVPSFQLLDINPGLINQGCTNLQAGETICLSLTNEDCKTIHTVTPHDTCQSITAKYVLSSDVLQVNNPQTQADGVCNLNIGEVLCVSQKAQVPPSLSPPLTISLSPLPDATGGVLKITLKAHATRLIPSQSGVPLL